MIHRSIVAALVAALLVGASAAPSRAASSYCASHSTRYSYATHVRWTVNVRSCITYTSSRITSWQAHAEWHVLAAGQPNWVVERVVAASSLRGPGRRGYSVTVRFRNRARGLVCDGTSVAMANRWGPGSDGSTGSIRCSA